MKIIDKNVDFYDYCQNVYKDDYFTFDRNDSFELTKDILKKDFLYFLPTNGIYYMLLQVCNSFWLFKIDIERVSKYGKYDLNTVKSYSLEFVCSWKNYNKERALITLDIISFPFHFNFERKLTDNKLIMAINNGEYTCHKSINKHIFWVGNKKVEKHIPLLKSCGIAQLINPTEIYLAFEEYFSLEKQDNERRESIGLSNKEKIENHGFDIKKSFRGK